MWVLAVFLMAASAAGAPAQSLQSVAIGGTGRDPCSAWTQDRAGTTDAARESSLRRIEWVSGYFSAVNFFTTTSGSLHGGIDDRDGMIGWIDNYCRDHPAEPLFAAATDLVFQLRKKSASPKP